MNDKNELRYQHERERQKKRRDIAVALECGWSYDKIKRELGTSSSTISSVKKMMGGE